jgi:hypothetical protein
MNSKHPIWQVSLGNSVVRNVLRQLCKAAKTTTSHDAPFRTSSPMVIVVEVVGSSLYRSNFIG